MVGSWQGRSPLQPIYAFDPRFYRRLVPRIWREYLTEQAAGRHEDEE